MTCGWRGGRRGTQAAVLALNAAFMTLVLLLIFLAASPGALAATRGVARPPVVSAVTGTSGGLHPQRDGGRLESPASRTATQPGTAERWIWRGLAGCLILLGMMAVMLAVRAALEMGTRPGRHRHQEMQTPLAAPTGRSIPADGQRGSATIAAPSAGARARRLASVPSLEASCPLPISAPAVAQQEPLPAERELSAPQQESPTPELESPPSQRAAATADPPNEPGGSGWPPVPGATREPATTVGSAKNGTVFSPAAMRLLGVRTSAEGEEGPDAAVLRHEVALGDVRVKAVLAKGPAGKREGKSPEVQTWVASTPYLVWTPLPHDVPAGGLAFVCLGAADSGCLFIDLAAAPGAVALRGEREAVTRLAESIAHQMRSGPAADRIHLVAVGDAIPPPRPPGTEWVASLTDLRPRGRPDLGDQAELIFCRLTSEEDAFPLARYVAGAAHRVVPLVLADLPGAPWSFTVCPSQRPSEVLQPVVF